MDSNTKPNRRSSPMSSGNGLVKKSGMVDNVFSIRTKRVNAMGFWGDIQMKLVYAS